MSYQSQIPILSQPPPPVAPPAKGKRHRGLLVLGLVLLFGGLLGGGAVSREDGHLKACRSNRAVSAQVRGWA